MITAGTAIFIALIITSVLEVRGSKSWMEEQLNALTEVVARNSVSAVVFDDADSAVNTLSALGVKGNIIYAEIITNKGKIFATYGKPVTTSSQINVQSISRKLEMNGEVYGYLRVMANFNDMWESVFLQWAFTLAGLLFAFLVSYIVLKRLSKYILEPIENLAMATREISKSKKYSLRVLKTSKDELGVLVDEFNEMLSQIEKRDEQLSQHRKNLEIEVKRRTDEAVMEKAANSAKSQFLANMSHEIRTPMNGVLGMAELLLATKLDPKQKRFAETVYRSAEALLGIINDILDFSKIEAGHLNLEIRDIDLKGLLTEAMSLFSDKAMQKGVQLHLDFSPNVPIGIRGDSLRLRQIIINLLSNAIKFSENGRVDVIVEKPFENKLMIRVKDTGIGIAPEVIPSLFTAFNQADNSTTRRYGGTGLGLAIAKELAELMGGTLTVESSLGVGSVFTIVLPLQEAFESVFPDEMKEKLFDLMNPTLIGIKVLLVEDNPVNQEVAAAILSGLGCQLKLANNGKEAIMAYQTEKFDIILMDCQMPIMDGYTASEKIRSIEREGDLSLHIPIIALTAQVMGGDREKCVAAGMDDYLPKPFSIIQLESLMRRYLGDVKVREIESEKSKLGITPLVSESLVFDAEPLEALKKIRTEGWEALVLRILAIFRENAPRLIEEMKRGRETQDLEAIRRAAHSLKSSAANIGAMNLAAFCKEIEQEAAEAKKMCDEQTVQTLIVKYQEVQQALNQYSGGIND